MDVAVHEQPGGARQGCPSQFNRSSNLGSRILVSTYCFFKQLHGRIELASLGDYDFIFAIYFPQFQSNLALPC